MQTIKLNGWVAEDESGAQFFYYNEPYRERGEWFPNGASVIDNLNRLDLGPDWTKSKRQVIDNVIQDPRPDLKVDDPVFVRDSPDEEWSRQHFKDWLTGPLVGERIICFDNGTTSFSASIGYFSVWNEYKLP